MSCRLRSARKIKADLSNEGRQEHAETNCDSQGRPGNVQGANRARRGQAGLPEQSAVYEHSTPVHFIVK
ncbi:MAG: hypothetical protein BCS36_05945 [Desulfovibrio sp. MES5]|nr:MAG: hypothetical protein BCS36_05945 [Desulfovibrio sp. MES5]